MSEKNEIKEKAIRVVWGSGEDIPALYTNHIFVSHAGGTEFYLIFGHLSPPITIGLVEEELPTSVVIKPVAKLIVSPDVMKAFVRVLNDNLKNFEERELEKNGKEEENE